MLEHDACTRPQEETRTLTQVPSGLTLNKWSIHLSSQSVLNINRCHPMSCSLNPTGKEMSYNFLKFQKLVHTTPCQHGILKTEQQQQQTSTTVWHYFLNENEGSVSQCEPFCRSSLDQNLSKLSEPYLCCLRSTPLQPNERTKVSTGSFWKLSCWIVCACVCVCACVYVAYPNGEKRIRWITQSRSLLVGVCVFGSRPELLS